MVYLLRPSGTSGKTEAELLFFFPTVRSASHSAHAALTLVHPLNNYDINVSEYTVALNYVDESGVSIGPSIHKYYTVPMMGTFTLASPEILHIPDYVYAGWKIEPADARQDNKMIKIPNVMADTKLYLIYREARTTSLTISKTVSGDYGDRSMEFTFTVYFEDSAGRALADGTVFGYTSEKIPGANENLPTDGILTLALGGTASFALAHGQSVTLEGVAANGRIRVIENPVSMYTASFLDSEDTFLSNGWDTGTRNMTEAARTFHFTNAWSAMLEDR